jgi:hypothetical protein
MRVRWFIRGERRREATGRVMSTAWRRPPSSAADSYPAMKERLPGTSTGDVEGVGQGDGGDGVGLVGEHV